MFKKIKTTLACCSALMMLCAVPLNVNAAEEVKINDAASVAVGDTFTYSMYIADASKDVMGMQAYVFYDTDYLEIDTSSISFETLNGVIYNGNLDGYMTFNFSDINNYADFSSRSQLVSMNFKVKKAGNTNVRYFIKEMYDSNMVTLSAYTITYDIVYNEKTTQGNFEAENKNTYLQFTITHTFTAEQASAIESDNLALLVIPQESHLKSTASYNVSEFRIDYVEMKIQY